MRKQDIDENDLSNFEKPKPFRSNATKNLSTFNLGTESGPYISEKTDKYDRDYKYTVPKCVDMKGVYSSKNIPMGDFKPNYQTV